MSAGLRDCDPLALVRRGSFKIGNNLHLPEEPTTTGMVYESKFHERKAAAQRAAPNTEEHHSSEKAPRLRGPDDARHFALSVRQARRRLT